MTALSLANSTWQSTPWISTVARFVHAVSEVVLMVKPMSTNDTLCLIYSNPDIDGIGE